MMLRRVWGLAIALLAVSAAGCGVRAAETPAASPTATITSVGQVVEPMPSQIAPRPTVPVVRQADATPSPGAEEIGALPTPPPPEPGGDPAFYYGGLRITLDEVGEEVSLRRREWFLLALGDDFDWQVITEPEAVLSISARYTPAPGEQGIYVARASGEAILRATGDPKCRRANPPCTRPSVLFEISVVVE